MRTICLLLALTPFCLSAQTNIAKAFDKLINNSDVVRTQSHSMEKDVKTGLKESQCDIYTFELPASKKGVVENILKAFKTDENKAYSTSSGVAGQNDREINLAVGDGVQGVRINASGHNYIYSCFMAPEAENPEGIYRYGYGMNWKEHDGKINGSLVVTYATTLKHRQSVSNSNNGYFVFRNGTLSDASQISDNSTWFGKFMGYVQAMSSGNTKACQALAAKIYEHTKLTESSSDIKKADKDTAREILKTLLSDRKYNDNVTIKLINAAITNIK